MARRSSRPTHHQQDSTEAAYARAVSIADACTDAGVPKIIASVLSPDLTDQEVAACIEAEVAARDVAEAMRKVEAGQAIH